jgi:hypothetical protein
VNLNYSYKAFLITSLLVGNLILLLVSVKLTKSEEIVEEETMAVEYAEIFPEEEEVIALTTAQEKMEIQTHSAFNEAEKFISEIENSRNESLEEESLSEPKSYEYDNSGDGTDFGKAQEKLEEVKDKLAEAAAIKKKLEPSKSVNRKTTITYRLVDRKSVDLLNPVYTCDAGGKIVITIEVNGLGEVVQANYNPTLSTTTNVCLIEAALEYAKGSLFNAKADKPKQLGTISYVFPGQE